MRNFNVEMIKVLTPEGDTAVFFTNRDDRRTDAYLAKEVPGYFATRATLGEGYVFVSRVFLLENLTKLDGERALAGYVAIHTEAGDIVLNGRPVGTKAQTRPPIELVEAA